MMKSKSALLLAKFSLLGASFMGLSACETTNSNANWKVYACIDQFAGYAKADDKKAMYSGEYSYKEDRCHVSVGHATQSDANNSAKGQCYRQDAVNDPMRCAPIAEGMRLSPLAVNALRSNPNGGPELLGKLRDIGYSW